jgi:hypothetical protein
VLVDIERVGHLDGSTDNLTFEQHIANAALFVSECWSKVAAGRKAGWELSLWTDTLIHCQTCVVHPFSVDIDRPYKYIAYDLRNDPVGDISKAIILVVDLHL